MNVTLWVGLAGTVSSIVFAYAGYRRGSRVDDTGAGRTQGSLASDVGYIKAGIDDLKRQQKDTAVTLTDHAQRLVRCEESCKQAHKRIDELRQE